jgi:hypothetical protein
MNAISLLNRLPYRAIHKRFIIWSNNYGLNNFNKVSPPIKHEGRIIIHPSEKCDIFNKYFADISNIEDEPNLPNEDFARNNICPELLITEQEVKDQLEILNNSKQSGPDGVAPRILRSALFPLLHYYLISHCNVDNFHIFGNAHM